MKNGYRVIDTDTHVGPNLETLEQYAGPVLRERWGELAGYFSPITDGGHQLSISPYSVPPQDAREHGARRRCAAGRAGVAAEGCRHGGARHAAERRASTTSTPPVACTTWTSKASTCT